MAHAGTAWDGARFEDFERTGWAKRAGTYDRGFAQLTAGVHQELLDRAGVRPGIRMLEVGCGTGRLSAAALARGAEVVATDAVHEMVAAARSALPGARALRAVLPDLPFAARCFDAAVGAFVINHVADPPAAVAGLARVVAPGGRVVLSCWDAAERNRAQSVVFDAAAAAGARVPTGVPAGSPFLRHSGPGGFAALLRGAGLTGVRVEAVSWTHRVAPEQWWQDILSGTVLTSALIERQDPATVARIRAAYYRLVAEYDAGRGLVELPVAALVAVGGVG